MNAQNLNKNKTLSAVWKHNEGGGEAHHTGALVVKTSSALPVNFRSSPVVRNDLGRRDAEEPVSTVGKHNAGGSLAYHNSPMPYLSHVAALVARLRKLGRRKNMSTSVC